MKDVLKLEIISNDQNDIIFKEYADTVLAKVTYTCKTVNISMEKCKLINKEMSVQISIQ